MTAQPTPENRRKDVPQRGPAPGGGTAAEPEEALRLVDIDYRTELIRKAIHLCSISIPLIYFYTPRTTALIILAAVTVLFLAVDIVRYYSPFVEQRFNRLFGFLLREHERDRAKKNLNGATYVLLAATACVFIFPKIIAVTAFIVLIICDMISALVGRRYGRHRIYRKSLEGSAAFFVSALLVIVATPKIAYLPGEYGIGFAAAAVGTVVEALPIPMDDNFSVPLSVGAALWLGYALFLPALDLYKFG